MHVSTWICILIGRWLIYSNREVSSMIDLYTRVVGLIYFDPEVDDLCVFGNILMICL